jgi:hypothetical protein
MMARTGVEQLQAIQEVVEELEVLSKCRVDLHNRAALSRVYGPQNVVDAQKGSFQRVLLQLNRRYAPNQCWTGIPDFLEYAHQLVDDLMIKDRPIVDATDFRYANIFNPVITAVNHPFDQMITELKEVVKNFRGSTFAELEYILYTVWEKYYPEEYIQRYLNRLRVFIDGIECARDTPIQLEALNRVKIRCYPADSRTAPENKREMARVHGPYCAQNNPRIDGLAALCTRESFQGRWQLTLSQILELPRLLGLYAQRCPHMKQIVESPLMGEVLLISKLFTAQCVDIETRLRDALSVLPEGLRPHTRLSILEPMRFLGTGVGISPAIRQLISAQDPELLQVVSIPMKEIRCALQEDVSILYQLTNWLDGVLNRNGKDEIMDQQKTLIKKELDLLDFPELGLGEIAVSLRATGLKVRTKDKTYMVYYGEKQHWGCEVEWDGGPYLEVIRKGRRIRLSVPGLPTLVVHQVVAQDRHCLDYLRLVGQLYSPCRRTTEGKVLP